MTGRSSSSAGSPRTGPTGFDHGVDDQRGSGRARNTLATELPPIRINAVHPGIVGDSPFWADKPLDHIVARTPGGRLATMADVADAVEFLLHRRRSTASTSPSTVAGC